jgi:hypothetical protein
MSGNLARKRMTKFMPADFKLIETRQPPLKDLYDEWLARIICYAFSVPASAFVSQVNRATSETLRLQATQEGLIPLKAWVKSALDYVIQVCMNEPVLEFVWVGDDAIDPLEQAQTLQILVSAGIKTREEARAELGLGGAAPAMVPAGLGKYNHNHDEHGRFTTADAAVATVGGPARKPRPTGVQVASNDAVTSDAGGPGVAQIIEPEPLPPSPESPEAPRPEESAPAAPTLEEIANGKFPGVAEKLGVPRTLPASDDPGSAAQPYMEGLAAGQSYIPVESDLDALGGRVIKLADGTYTTYRPPGVSGSDTLPTTASVDINNPQINSLNNGNTLKLKFPKK